MKVTLDNQTIDIDNTNKLNAHEFLIKKQLIDEDFALMINGEFIPRSQYESFQIKENDVIDIITPMQGG